MNISLRSLFILIGSALLLSGCLTYKEVTYSGVKNVTIEKVSTSEIKLKVTVEVNNPNTYKIKLVDGEFNVLSDDFNFGTFELAEDVVIPAESKGDVNVYVETKFKSLFSSSMTSLMRNVQKNNIPITVKGHITAKAMLFRKKIKFSETENISL